MVHVAGAQLGLVATTVLGLASASFLAGPAQARLDLAASRPSTRPVAASAPVAPAADAAPVIRLQDLSPEAARLWNASNPISRLPNPPAKPFHLDAEGVLDEARATDCMTAAIYYEAGNESLDGQRAVAQVVLNRLRHPAFAKTVCGVVFQGAGRGSGCQFTFTCDGALARTPDADGWARSRQVAEAALNGYVMKKVGEATHYHAVYVAPYWSPTLIKVSAIGAHIFYRWTGGAGLPPAFGGEYVGGETQGVKVAALDELARKTAKLTPAVAEPAEPQAPVVETAAAQPAVKAAEPASAVVAATDALAATPPAAAFAAGAVVAAQDLDWQGRPKDRAAPRLAMPSHTGF